jgi:hypothetical protein
MSFWNLYRRRRAQASYTVAIACAMSGILMVNVWSFVLFVSLIDHGWLAERRRISPGEFSALLLGVLLAELIFVNFVQNKVAQDVRFAIKVKASPPSISIWYAIVSVALLAVSTILAIVFH